MITILRIGFIIGIIGSLISFAALSILRAKGAEQPKPIGPRHLRTTNAPPKPLTPEQQAARAEAVRKAAIPLGPRHELEVAPGVKITITSTNTFTAGQLRQWLRQASTK